MKRLDSAEINGNVTLAIGDEGRCLIQFMSDAPIDQDLRVNLVVTMRDGKIASMQDYRRAAKARRAANVTA